MTESTTGGVCTVNVEYLREIEKRAKEAERLSAENEILRRQAEKKKDEPGANYMIDQYRKRAEAAEARQRGYSQAVKDICEAIAWSVKE